MFIENPDAFKSWLTSILEPLCDADPAALAKYVYALVKKDKPLEELRDGMVDQLDVFLQHETKPFVEMLFKSLESQEHLKTVEKVPSPQPEPPAEPQETLAGGGGGGGGGSEHPSNGLEDVSPPHEADSRARSPAPAPARHRVVLRGAAGGGRLGAPPPPAPARTTHPTHEQTLVKVLPLNELLEEPVEPPRRRERRDGMHDRRRRRSRSWERRGGPGGRRRGGRGAAGEEGRRERSVSPRSRGRNRSPPEPMRGSLSPHRDRSRSPIPLRDHHERERDRLRMPREMERDRISRDRDHRDRLSRSRDRDRSRERSRDRSRGSLTPHPEERPHRDHDQYKRRCRDFDEKGYCMRGDLCQWDHGLDPVVLEDAALTRVLIPPPAVPEYNPLAPDIWGGGFPPHFPGGPHPLGPHPHPLPPPPHHMLPHPPRELVPIPRVRHEPPPPMMAMPLPRPPPLRKHFDYNRLGPARPPMPMYAANCSLEVKKVPRGMNDITHLNNHFSKFGKIVNIQVCHEGDPEAALITFSSPSEANVAHKSTEAVLNNRFIKVFWHNPENKQENTPPGQQNKQNNGVNNQHPGSVHRSLINRDNMKATADLKQADKDKEKEKAKEQNGCAPGTEPVEPAKPAEPPKQVKVMEMHRRAQALLQTQLQQQVLLIQKLESGNVTGPQKTALLEAINSAQEGIEKLRKELVAYNNTIRQMQDETVSRSLAKLQLAQTKKPKTREEAQKEILDAELDMFTKQQEGQDVTDLAKKIAELRRQMSLQFPAHHIARRPHPSFHPGRGRYNTATRFTRGAGAAPKPPPHSTAIDHRPKALRVSGFEPDDLQALVNHFSQFGEVVGKEVNPAVPELVLQYKARGMAEQAMLRGRHYNDRTLSITWCTNAKPPGAGAGGAATHNGDAAEHGKEPETPSSLSEDSLLRFDEEEEEDAEDRSWRR